MKKFPVILGIALPICAVAVWAVTSFACDKERSAAATRVTVVPAVEATAPAAGCVKKDASTSKFSVIAPKAAQACAGVSVSQFAFERALARELALAGVPDLPTIPDMPAPVAKARVPATPTGNFDSKMSAICQKSCAAKADYSSTDLAPQPGAMIGQLTRCPVSGVVFEFGEENPRVLHAGREYVLCCGGCAQVFRKHTSRFIAPS